MRRRVSIAFAVILASMGAWSRPAAAGDRTRAIRAFVDAQYEKGNGEAPTRLLSGSTLQYAHVGAQAIATYALAKSLHIDAAWEVPVATGVAWLGWQVADLAAGTIHAGADGYGSPNTPLLGSFLRIFKDHHRDALAQTRASLPYLVAPFTAITVPLMLWVGATDATGPVSTVLHALTLGFGVGLSLAGVSHKYSHMRDRVGIVVKGLRSAGLFMEPSEHDRHHRFPNSKAFGQLSGRTNKLAERVRYYEGMQALLYHTTGAAHDSWRNPRGGYEAMVAVLGPDPAKHPKLR